MIYAYYDESLHGWGIPSLDVETLQNSNHRVNYQCEHNETKTSPRSEKSCNFRGKYYSEQVYQWWVNYGCFQYTQPNLLKPQAKPNITTCSYNSNDTDKAPCFIIEQPSGLKCFQLDEKSPVILNELRKLFVSEEIVKRWIRCTKASRNCCKDVMLHSQPTLNTCPAVWDAWTCFHPQEAGKVSREVCTEFAYSNAGPACHHFSKKQCLSDGQWNQTTDYSTCSVTGRLVARVNMHIACLAVAIVLGVPAVIVLASYRRLRARRLALHRNLLAAILIRNLLVIITKSVVVLDELQSSSDSTVMSRNEFPCRMLATMEKLASSAAFTCMLVDGIFLHRTIVAVFKKELNYKIVYSLAAVSTVIPVIIWASLMSVYNDNHCWIVYSTPGIQWVLDGPRIAMLAVNTILLIDILRILLTKLRRKENSNQLSTTKATLFLMPLFGVQFLLTAWRPNTTSCDTEQAYYFFTFIMDGFQGIMVAVLYCYLNKEVHTLLITTYKKTENVVNNRFRAEPRRRRVTSQNIGARRETFSTMVDSQPNREYDNNDNLEDDNNAQSDARRFETPVTDSGVDFGENIQQPDMLTPPVVEDYDSCNSFTILNNAYSPSEDGFISLDFEYDEAPPNARGCLQIPPYSPCENLSDYFQEENNLQDNNKNYSNVWAINPAFEEDIPKIHVTKCENVMTNIDSTFTNGHISSTNTYFNAGDDSEKRLTLEIKDPKIFISSGYEDHSLVANHDALNNNKTKNVSKVIETNMKTVNPFIQIADLNKEDQLSDSASRKNSSVSMNSLSEDIVENIDALELSKEENFKNSVVDSQRLKNKDWDDVYIDPMKLCPNRPKSDKIVFLNE